MSYINNRFTILFVIVLFFNLSIFAGPFGLEMGMKLEEIEKITGNKPQLVSENLYNIIPQKKHPLFETYLVRVNKQEEIYYIKAISKHISTSRYGSQLRNEFENIVDGLEKNYGRYKLMDFLSHKSIWDEPRDFMMGLIEKERYLMAFWDRDEGSDLSEDLMSVSIAAYALSTTKGYLAVDYEFINADEAEKQMKEDSDSIL